MKIRTTTDMKIFQKKNKKTKESMNALENKLDMISELTRDLGQSEFNNLIEAVKAVYEARKRLAKVKTNEEKENQDITDIEKGLDYLEK